MTMPVILLVRAWVLVQINGIVSYTITFTSSCAKRSDVFRQIYGISLRECAIQCGNRPGCVAINYYRKRRGCLLLNSDVPPINTGGRCVYIPRSDIVPFEYCTCNRNQVCGDGSVPPYQCSFEECETQQLDNGVIRGNMNKVGSVITYRCHNSYTALTSTSGVTCLGTGQWSDTPRCDIDCGEPDEGINTRPFTGPTTVGNSRNYICDTGFVSVENQKETSIISTCLSTGVWSVLNVQCVVANQIGDYCDSDTDCSNTMSTCIENKCFCDVFYRWSDSSDDCSQVCNSLTTEFDVFPNTYIVQYNGLYTPDLSEDNCRTSCLQDDRCYYYEVRSDGCITGHVTIGMLHDADPDAIAYSSSGITIHSRKCERLPMVGLSLRDCVQECAARAGCSALNYYRRRHVCLLNGYTYYQINSASTNYTSTPIIFNNNGTKQPWVYIDRADIQWDNACSCPQNQVCREGHGGFVCETKECSALDVANGQTYGNMNMVGSVARYVCDRSYQPSNITKVTCKATTGLWDPSYGCIIDCGEPTIESDTDTTILIEGETTLGSVRTYMCTDGYAPYVNQKLRNVTITCQNDGNWTDVVKCVLENQVGDVCTSDTDCVNTMSICNYGICFSDALYRWNHTMNDCVKVCSTMSSTLMPHQKVYIQGYNTHKKDKLSSTDCEDDCQVDPACYHVEDWDNMCRFSNITLDMAKDAIRNKVKYDRDDVILYSRICN